jgi:KEOPS complex subunit Cgi121
MRTIKFPNQASPHSIVSGEYMDNSGERYEIRQAKMTVTDRDECLRMIQEIARNHSTRIVCFDAEKLAGREHADAAIRHAQRSILSAKPISNSFEMEALLFAAGTRQCSVASLFGIHKGENKMFVCLYPVKEEVWKALSYHMHFVTETWDNWSALKIARMISLFGITQDELETVGQERIKDLILERIALLEVCR